MVQTFHQKQFSMGEISVGRFETLDFGNSTTSSGAEGVARFTVVLIDAALVAPR
jgi:hypothetical protein